MVGANDWRARPLDRGNRRPVLRGKIPKLPSKKKSGKPRPPSRPAIKKRVARATWEITRRLPVGNKRKSTFVSRVSLDFSKKRSSRSRQEARADLPMEQRRQKRKRDPPDPSDIGPPRVRQRILPKLPEHKPVARHTSTNCEGLKELPLLDPVQPLLSPHLLAQSFKRGPDHCRPPDLSRARRLTPAFPRSTQLLAAEFSKFDRGPPATPGSEDGAAPPGAPDDEEEARVQAALQKEANAIRALVPRLDLAPDPSVFQVSQLSHATAQAEIMAVRQLGKISEHDRYANAVLQTSQRKPPDPSTKRPPRIHARDIIRKARFCPWDRPLDLKLGCTRKAAERLAAMKPKAPGDEIFEMNKKSPVMSLLQSGVGKVPWPHKPLRSPPSCQFPKKIRLPGAYRLMLRLKQNKMKDLVPSYINGKWSLRITDMTCISLKTPRNGSRWRNMATQVDFPGADSLKRFIDHMVDFCIDNERWSLLNGTRDRKEPGMNMIEPSKADVNGPDSGVTIKLPQTAPRFETPSSPMGKASVQEKWRSFLRQCSF